MVRISPHPHPVNHPQPQPPPSHPHPPHPTPSQLGAAVDSFYIHECNESVPSIAETQIFQNWTLSPTRLPPSKIGDFSFSVRQSVCGKNRVRSVSSTIIAGSISYLYISSTNINQSELFPSIFPWTSTSCPLYYLNLWPRPWSWPCILRWDALLTDVAYKWLSLDDEMSPWQPNNCFGNGNKPA